MKQILLLMTLAMVVLVCPRLAHGEALIEAWVQRYNGLVTGGNDSPTAVAVDTNGNVFVTGYSPNPTAGVGGVRYNDYLTIKYSAVGVPLWTNRYNGPGNLYDEAYAIAVDGNGDVFVTGRSNGGGSSSDYGTIKYSGAGVPLWTNRYNGTYYFNGATNAFDTATAIALDTDGNVFVTGNSSGNGSSDDYATIKYSGAGVALWTNRYNGPGNNMDRANALAVDGSGNVFVTGLSSGSPSSHDYATIKYSGAGVPLWTNRYNGTWNDRDEALAVAVDTNGNVFVTGFSALIGSGWDYATIKYSGVGLALWTNFYSGPANGDDFATAMAVDGSGNVFVTGQSVGSGGFNDYATIKYSGAGVPLWTNRFDGGGRDEARAVAVDTSGNVFVTGRSSAGGSNHDYATIKYSGAGVPLCTNLYNGPANAPDVPTDLALDGRGNVFVTGISSGSGSDYDYATIKYSPIPPSLTVSLTTTNTVAIFWPSSPTVFTLQQNTNDLTTVNWSNVLTTPTDNGTTKTVIVNPHGGTRFYRLSSP